MNRNNQPRETTTGTPMAQRMLSVMLGAHERVAEFLIPREQIGTLFSGSASDWSMANPAPVTDRQSFRKQVRG